MITSYQYPLWNGKKIVGFVTTIIPFMGTHVVFPYEDEFKRKYGIKLKSIKVPILWRDSTIMVDESCYLTTTKANLDVRRKSKAQIKFILQNKRLI